VAGTLADLHERGIVHGRLGGDHVVGGARALLCGFAGAQVAAVDGTVDAAVDIAAFAALVGATCTTDDRPSALARAAVAALTADPPTTDLRAVAEACEPRWGRPSEAPSTSCLRRREGGCSCRGRRRRRCVGGGPGCAGRCRARGRPPDRSRAARGGMPGPPPSGRRPPARRRRRPDRPPGRGDVGSPGRWLGWAAPCSWPSRWARSPDGCGPVAVIRRRRRRRPGRRASTAPTGRPVRTNLGRARPPPSAAHPVERRVALSLPTGRLRSRRTARRPRPRHPQATGRGWRQCLHPRGIGPATRRRTGRHLRHRSARDRTAERRSDRHG
jgi:hypothetical protein